MKYTLSKNIDGYNVPMGNVKKRVLKQLGDFLFSIDEQRVEFNGIDTLNIPVWQRWEKISGKIYMGEFVKVSHLKLIHIDNPSTAIWHSASFTIDGASAIVDAAPIYNRGGYEQRNYGTRPSLHVGNDHRATNRDWHSLIWFNTLDDSMRAIGAVTSWDSAMIGLIVFSDGAGGASLSVTTHKLSTNLWEEGTSDNTVGCGVTWDSANADAGGACGGTPTDWTDGGDYSATRETYGSHPDSIILSDVQISVNDTIYFYISGSTISDTMGDNAGIIIVPSSYITDDNTTIGFDSDDGTEEPFMQVWYTAGEPPEGWKPWMQIY